MPPEIHVLLNITDIGDFICYFVDCISRMRICMCPLKKKIDSWNIHWQSVLYGAFYKCRTACHRPDIIAVYVLLMPLILQCLLLLSPIVTENCVWYERRRNNLSGFTLMAVPALRKSVQKVNLKDNKSCNLQLCCESLFTPEWSRPLHLQCIDLHLIFLIWVMKVNNLVLMFIGPCIIVIVEE